MTLSFSRNSINKNSSTTKNGISFPNVFQSSSFSPRNIRLSKHAKTKSVPTDNENSNKSNSHQIEMNINQFDIKCYVNNNDSVQNMLTMRNEGNKRNTIPRSDLFSNGYLDTVTNASSIKKDNDIHKGYNKIMTINEDKNINLIFTSGNIFDYNTRLSLGQFNDDQRCEMRTEGNENKSKSYLQVKKNRKRIQFIESVDDIENKALSLSDCDKLKESILNKKKSHFCSLSDCKGDFDVNVKATTKKIETVNSYCLKNDSDKKREPKNNKHEHVLLPQCLTRNNTKANVPIKINHTKPNNKVTTVSDENSQKTTGNLKRVFIISPPSRKSNKKTENEIKQDEIKSERTIEIKRKEDIEIVNINEEDNNKVNCVLNENSVNKNNINTANSDNNSQPNVTQDKPSTQSSKELKKKNELYQSLIVLKNAISKKIKAKKSSSSKMLSTIIETGLTHNQENETNQIDKNNKSPKKPWVPFQFKTKAQEKQSIQTSSFFERNNDRQKTKINNKAKIIEEKNSSSLSLSDGVEDSPQKYKEEEYIKTHYKGKKKELDNNIPFNSAKSRKKSKTILFRRNETKIKSSKFLSNEKKNTFRLSYQRGNIKPLIPSSQIELFQPNSVKDKEIDSSQLTDIDHLSNSSLCQCESEKMMANIFNTISQANQLDQQLNASYSYDEIDCSSQEYKTYYNFCASQKEIINKKRPLLAQISINRKENFLINTIKHLKQNLCYTNNEIHRKNFIAELASKIDDIKDNITIDQIIVKSYQEIDVSVCIEYKIKDILLTKYLDMLDDITESINDDIRKLKITNKKTKRSNAPKPMTPDEMIKLALEKAENTMFVHCFIKQDITVLFNDNNLHMIALIRKNINKNKTNSISPSGGHRKSLREFKHKMSKSNTLDTVIESANIGGRSNRIGSPIKINMKGYLSIKKKKRSDLAIADFLQYNRRLKREKTTLTIIKKEKVKDTKRKKGKSSPHKHFVHCFASNKELTLLRTYNLKQNYITSLGDNKYELFAFYIQDSNLNKVDDIYKKNQCDFNINHVDLQGNSFVILAVQSNDYGICEYLLKIGCNPNIQNVLYAFTNHFCRIDNSQHFITL